MEKYLLEIRANGESSFILRDPANPVPPFTTADVYVIAILDGDNFPRWRNMHRWNKDVWETLALFLEDSRTNWRHAEFRCDEKGLGTYWASYVEYNERTRVKEGEPFSYASMHFTRPAQEKHLIVLEFYSIEGILEFMDEFNTASDETRAKLHIDYKLARVEVEE